MHARLSAERAESQALRHQHVLGVRPFVHLAATVACCLFAVSMERCLVLKLEGMSDPKLLSRDGSSDQVLLIGIINGLASGAGLFLFDGDQIQRLDTLATAGVQIADHHLVRMLSSDTEPDSCGELLFYDRAGVERYARIAALSDAHDLTWDDDSIVCTATGINSLLWVSLFGELRRVWRAPGENDAWHLNGLWRHQGKTYVSAFGIFHRHREWNEGGRANSGIIYNLNDERVEISGLNCPHNPVFLQEGWLVCNSGTAEVFNLGADGQLKRRLQLNSWTRGFSYSDRYYFVGESADRKQLTAGACAHLAIVNRRTWQVCDRFAVPGTEITFLALVHKHWLSALRRGFRTNPLREANYDNHNLLRTTGTDPLHLLTLSEPLPKEALKIRIKAEVPREVTAGSRFRVQVDLENLGTGILASTAPCPVHLTYRWFKRDGQSEVEQPEEGFRTRLSRPMPPRYSLECPMTVLAPRAAGSYRLQISLIQEWVMRFDSADLNNACSASVEVREQSASAGD